MLTTSSLLSLEPGRYYNKFVFTDHVDNFQSLHGFICFMPDLITTKLIIPYKRNYFEMAILI